MLISMCRLATGYSTLTTAVVSMETAKKCPERNLLQIKIKFYTNIDLHMQMSNLTLEVPKWLQLPKKLQKKCQI